MPRPTIESALRILFHRRNIGTMAMRLACRAMIRRDIAALRGA